MIDRARLRVARLIATGTTLMIAAVALGRRSAAGAGREWLWSSIAAYLCALRVLALALGAARRLQEPDYDAAVLARAL